MRKTDFYDFSGNVYEENLEYGNLEWDDDSGNLEWDDGNPGISSEPTPNQPKSDPRPTPNQLQTDPRPIPDGPKTGEFLQRTQNGGLHIAPILYR